MSATQTLPDVDTSFQIVKEAIDKRAFLECLSQLGHAPSNAAEADHLYGIGLKIAQAEADPLFNKEAANQQPGPYAFAETALDRFLGIKSASAPVAAASGLDDVSIAWAMELASDPQIFAAALVTKAAQQAAMAQQQV